MNLADRKRAELKAKLRGLSGELCYWLTQSEAGQEYEKHHRQIRRLAPQLEGLLSSIQDDLNGLTAEEDLLKKARTLELRLLATQSLWDYFRSKLILRSNPRLGLALKAADAFTWSCYEPVWQKYGADSDFRREPPLVAPLHNWSPSALSRNHRYEVAHTPGGFAESSNFLAVIETLPVPVIGLPWQYFDHLPNLALLAHEVGHVVEKDFGLDARWEKSLEIAFQKDSRARAWLAWRSEVFADMFACYAAGPAYVWALAEAIAASVFAVTHEKQAETWGEYPTATLRIKLAAEMLRQSGFTDDATAVLGEWNESYTENAMEEFEDDILPVVSALRQSQVLPAQLAFEELKDQSTKACQILKAWPDLNTVTESTLQQISSCRAWIAGAADAYRSDPEKDHQNSWMSVRSRILKTRKPGVLAINSDTTTLPKINPEAEHATGRRLAEKLFASVEASFDKE